MKYQELKGYKYELVESLAVQTGLTNLSDEIIFIRDSLVFFQMGYFL